MTAFGSLDGRAPALRNNSLLVLALFGVSLLFQDTALKYIWGLELPARLSNLAALAVMSIAAIYSLMRGRFDRRVWYLYLIPGAMVFAGMLINITRSVLIDTNAISYYGLVLPWAAFLLAPTLWRSGMLDSESLWKAFYYFMVVTVALGLSDYVNVLRGSYSLQEITTPNGVFLVGRFSLLHVLEDGTPHLRFYGWFFEPGSLAMFLLPAIAYAALHRRYIGLAIMLVGFYFTLSLGGFIGLMMLAALLGFGTFDKARMVIPAALLAVALLGLLWLAFGDFLIEAYNIRTGSRTVREESFKNTIVNLPAMVFNYPIGFRFDEGSPDIGGPFDFGTNFTIGNALRFGGVSALLGYVSCLLVSFACAAKMVLVVRPLTVHEKVVFISILVLLPFVVQRAVIWDSTMFAFLFAPSVLAVIVRRRHGISHYGTRGSPRVANLGNITV